MDDATSGKPEATSEERETTSGKPDGVPAQLPREVAVGRVMLFVNAGLLMLGLLYPSGLLPFFLPVGVLFVVPLLAFAVISAVLGTRMHLGLKSTRLWANLVASFSILVGLWLASGPVDVVLLLALPTLGISVAVLVVMNRSEAHQHFQRQPWFEATGLPSTRQCPQCDSTVDALVVYCPNCKFGVRRMSGYAVASLVLGIIWLWGVGSVLALVFGYQARRRIHASGGALRGLGPAATGIVLGWLGIGVVGLGVVLALQS